MAKILFRLRMAPEDEAEDVRQLLDQAGFEWFETSAGRFGVSFPAIWLTHDEDWPRAKALFDAYQADRSQRMRADHKHGDTETFFARLLAHPLPILLTLCAVSVIAYFSVVPFFSLLDR